jgi:hypothetical protein
VIELISFNTMVRLMWERPDGAASARADWMAPVANGLPANGLPRAGILAQPQPPVPLPAAQVAPPPPPVAPAPRR